MASHQDFQKEVERISNDLHSNFPALLSSFDQQQQVRRLITDKKSKAFLCAVIILSGEQPADNAEPGSEGANPPDHKALMDQATSAILALESAQTPTSRNIPLSLTPAHDDGPGAFTVGGHAPAQSSVPGSRRRSVQTLEEEDEDVPVFPSPQVGETDSFFRSHLKEGTKFVKHLLPFGKEARVAWRDSIPLDSAASNILKSHLTKLGSKLVYKADHGLALGDTETVMDAIPFPSCNDGMEAKEIKSLVTSEVEVEPDPEFSTKSFKVPESQRVKNKELFVKQKSVRAELFKLALPLVEQTNLLHDLTECNCSAEELMATLLQAFAPSEEEDAEFSGMAREQQMESVVLAAFRHIHGHAELALQRATLGAHVLVSRDSELQLQRFVNVQPQDDKVKKSAFGRVAEDAFKPKGSLSKDEMTTNKFEQLTVGIASALQSRSFKGVKKPSGAGKGGVSRQGRRSRDWSGKDKGPRPPNSGLEPRSGYLGDNWLPPEERKRPPANRDPGLESRASKAAKLGSGKDPAGRR